MNNNSNSLAKLLPMMLCFFAMGFVDLVGIASNYVKADLNLTDSQANIFPSLVFFWFLIFSVPTGMLMNRIGRKKTVLLSLAVTFASLLLPVFGDGYALMLISFSLLVYSAMRCRHRSIRCFPMSSVESGSGNSLTFGQFVKAIASFLAPYIAMWGATQAIPSLGMGWRVLFPIYMVIAVVAILWLGTTSIHEEKEEGRPSTFGECLALLGKPFILSLFLGHHVPCGYRCRYKYHCTQDIDGTSGHVCLPMPDSQQVFDFIFLCRLTLLFSLYFAETCLLELSSESVCYVCWWQW